MPSRQRRHVEQRLRQLGVPDPPPPYTVNEWCAEIGRRRRRKIHIITLPLKPGEPTGVMWAAPEAECIFVSESLSPLSRRHTVLHELAHSLYGHGGLDSSSPDRVNDPEEHQAELAATVMAQWLEREAAKAAGRYFPIRVANLPEPSLGKLDSLMTASTLNTLQPVTRRIYRRWLHSFYLDGLWRKLSRTDPAPRLTEKSCMHNCRTSLPIHDAGTHYYNSIIRINDELNALRQFLPADVHQNATRRAQRAALSPTETIAVADAAAIAVALKARAAGEQPPSNIATIGREIATEGIDAEAARLAQVAKALATSPYVKAELARYSSRVL